MHKNWFLRLSAFKLKIADSLRHPLYLGVRLWMASIFWASGTLKMPAGLFGIGKGSWDSTLYLFENEHPVPYIPVKIAAIMGTSFEVVCALLLVFGLGTRFAAVILLIMTAFIQITYQQELEHIYWMVLFGMLITHGAGSFSLDYFIRRAALKE